LIDARRGIGKGDSEIMKLLDESAVSWAAVLTKADKLKPQALETICRDTEATIATHVAAFPELFVTSSQTGEGIGHLRGHIASFALQK
jgi:GTP-binding protein